MDRLVLNFTQQDFTPGQVYIALSPVRNIELIMFQARFLQLISVHQNQ